MRGQHGGQQQYSQSRRTGNQARGKPNCDHAFAGIDLVAVLMLPGVSSFTDPAALFLGTLSTATSVGITARILSEKHKMSSPEGVTILAAAVLDDVLGIIILAIVKSCFREKLRMQT